jgi:hypothetical protein
MTNYIARSNNGTYHKASHSRAHCNQRMYIGGAETVAMVDRAEANMFCEKCFRDGKPK